MSPVLKALADLAARGTEVRLYVSRGSSVAGEFWAIRVSTPGASGKVMSADERVYDTEIEVVPDALDTAALIAIRSLEAYVNRSSEV